MIDFSISPALESTRQDVAAFMEQYVYPNESSMVEHEGLPADLESDLQAKVKALWTELADPRRHRRAIRNEDRPESLFHRLLRNFCPI